MDRTDRLEAIGSRGEAVIIVRTWASLTTANCDGDQADDQELPTYRLATGERLFATDDGAAFVTRDQLRRFTLR
ncbi:hypothetical protein [Piscinibacter sakaiensis]|uniref:hypothetical protein n=1 Tax=Piscinibacter sakaiensis TaxID=1547922 RepID=UPI003AAE991E